MQLELEGVTCNLHDKAMLTKCSILLSIVYEQQQGSVQQQMDHGSMLTMALEKPPDATPQCRNRRGRLHQEASEVASMLAELAPWRRTSR